MFLNGAEDFDGGKFSGYVQKPAQRGDAMRNTKQALGSHHTAELPYLSGIGVCLHTEQQFSPKMCSDQSEDAEHKTAKGVEESINY